MSVFGKCKQCQAIEPVSGWVTKSKSLCVACAQANEDVLRIKRNEMRKAQMEAFRESGATHPALSKLIRSGVLAVALGGK